jgi:hypothetical protein
MTLQEIKLAVLSGQRVYWKQPNYEVIRDGYGQWFVKCTTNNHCTGLIWADGVTMDYNEDDFYIG